MELKKEKSINEFIKEKEARQVLEELSKEELIERYLYRMKAAVLVAYTIGLVIGLFLGLIFYYIHILMVMF